jgi:hypothetical protein
VKTIVGAIRGFWIDHLWLDWAAAGLMIGVHVVLILRVPGFDFFAYADLGERRGLYSSSAVVVSLLGAFSGVVIGQASSGKGSRITALKKHGAAILADNWRGIYLAAIFAALTALACLLVDVQNAGVAPPVPLAVRWIFEFALIACGIKFLRLTAIFHPIIESAALDDAEKDEPEVEAPSLHPKWARHEKRAG